MYDIIIIGGGAAGLTAAVYAMRAGKSVAIFEGDRMGGILNSIEVIENYPGFSSISGKELAKKLTGQAMAYSPAVIPAFAVAVTGSDGDFTVLTGSDAFKGKKVIYCGGAKRKTVKGADKFINVSYCAVCDGNFYKNKTVAVAGSGYAAIEDVRYLKNLCKKVYLIGKIDGQDSQVDTNQIGNTGGITEADLTGLTNVEVCDNQILSLVPDADNPEMLSAIVLRGKKTIETDGLFIAMGALSDNIIGYPLKEGRVADGLYVAGDAGSSFRQVVWACASAARAVSDIIKEL